MEVASHVRLRQSDHFWRSFGVIYQDDGIFPERQWRLRQVCTQAAA